MKKIILALACAVSVIVAKASDSAWFSGSASGTKLTATKAAWSQPDSGVTVAEGVIMLDLDTDAALTLTPDANSAPDKETKTSVNVTANFYPNAFEDLEKPAGAQTALAVAYATEGGQLSYYAWNGSKWVALSGVVPVSGGAEEVAAKIELDYYRSGKTKARFTIGSTIMTYTDTNGNQTWLPLTTDSRAVNSVAFAGSGKLKSVESTVELGVASVDNVKYPTLAEAVAAADAAGVTSITVVGQPLESDRVNGWTLNKTSSTYTKDQDVVVVSVAETMLIAVPRACTAAGLVDTSNRFEDDVLQVYNKTDGKYYTWTLNSEKAWVPATTFAISGGESSAHSMGATDISLSAGQAAWLTRTRAESKKAPIKLLVAYSEDAVTVTLESGTAQSPKWNLVASPSSEPIVLSALAEKVGDADAILIPTDGGAPRNLRKSGGKLVYDGYKTVGDKKIPVEVEVEDETIPVGTGFWYISGGTTQIEL